MSARSTSLRALALTVALASALLATGCQPLPGAPPGGVAPDCSDVPWGSAAKHVERMTSSPIVRVRATSQRCFDRVVIDLRSAPGAGWHVRYGTVHEQGTGDAVALRGHTSLEVVALAPAHDSQGHATLPTPNRAELVDVTGFRDLRQVAFAGSFEGRTTFGIGVRSRLPFRAFAVSGPSGTKLVVDVAHRWP